MWSKFQQNRSKNVEIRGDHRHTYTQTHRQGSSWDKIFSPEMTEYKKYDTALIANVNNHQHFKIESRSKHIVWIYLSSTQTEE